MDFLTSLILNFRTELTEEIHYSHDYWIFLLPLILIASEYFSELDVYKDGTLLNTFPITSGTKKITVGFSATGEYEAFLCNRTNGTITAQSKSCHWSVIA